MPDSKVYSHHIPSVSGILIDQDKVVTEDERIKLSAIQHKVCRQLSVSIMTTSFSCSQLTVQCGCIWNGVTMHISSLYYCTVILKWNNDYEVKVQSVSFNTYVCNGWTTQVLYQYFKYT